MKKVLLYAFRGETLCFVHVLLNALDMHERGYEVKIIFEGAATVLAPELNEPDSPWHELFRSAREKDLIACACLACARKMNVADEIENMGIPMESDMSGHPSLARYLEHGYEVISF